MRLLVDEADKLGKTMHDQDESHDEDSPKKNNKENGLSDKIQPTTSSSLEMEKFAEQAQRFKPTGNTLATANVIFLKPYFKILVLFRFKLSILYY